MRRKFILLNFTFVLLFFYGIFYANATAYRIGVQKGQELIWKCKVCNEREMTNIFGEEWDDLGFFKNLSEGKRMKWIINDIEIDDTFIYLNFSLWYWNNRNSWGVKDNDSQIINFSNPDDYSRRLNFSSYSSLVPFWFPIPVGEYMGGLNLNDWYDVDNRVLPTLNVEIGENSISPEVPSKDIKIIAIYNDQGILNSYKLYVGENYVILDIAFDFLPFYVIPTLLVLTCIILLGIAIFIIQKRKNVFTQKKFMVNRR